MVKNSSNSTKTINELITALPGDTWSIDNLIMYCNYNNTGILPEYNILDDYRDYFEQNGFIHEVPLDTKFHYSPQAFAYNYYGTADLDFLVMYFGKVTTLFEFNTPTIKVLASDRLKDLNNLIIAHKEQVKLNNIEPPLYTTISDSNDALTHIKKN